VDDYVLSSLETVERQKQTNSGLLTVFSSSSAYPAAASRGNLIKTFNYMADAMERELRELVLVLLVSPEGTR